MGMIITVSSGKGGTGKTTTVAAIASCLAVLEYKTLCIDFDAGMGNLDLALGMTDFAVMDCSDVISGRVDLLQACLESPQIKNLYFLAAPTDGELKENDRAAVAQMFTQIRENFDYCIVDSPPGIGPGFTLSHCNVDMSIVVTTGELPAMRDATRAAGILRDIGITNIRLIVNRVNRKKFKRIQMTVDDIIDTTGARLIGLIPEDNNIFGSVYEGVPLVLCHKRKSAYGFLDAAMRITGKQIPIKQY